MQHDPRDATASFVRSLAPRSGSLTATLLETVLAVAPDSTTAVERGAIRLFRRGNEYGYVWPMRGCVELGLRGIDGRVLATVKVHSRRQAASRGVREKVARAMALHEVDRIEEPSV